MSSKHTLMSLTLRSIFYTILHPGIMVGVIPYLLAAPQNINPNLLVLLLGIIVFILGLFISLYYIILFAKIGQGTLSPVDPTKNLVIVGLYKYSRNPMYIGVLLMVVSEAMIYESFKVLTYGFALFLLFQSFIVFWEEPRLKKEFGESYELYQKQVRRWF